jgi:hypothetical protein
MNVAFLPDICNFVTLIMKAKRHLNAIGMYDNYKYLVNRCIKSIYLAPPLSIYVAGTRNTTTKRDSCSVCGQVRFGVSNHKSG